MAEPKCVCGHDKEEHYRLDGIVPVKRCHVLLNEEEWCDCPQYRPVLPWPDSEGWWWSEWLEMPVLATKSKTQETAIFNPNGSPVHLDKYDWKDAYADDDRFVRLMEPNPFDQHTDGERPGTGAG